MPSEVPVPGGTLRVGVRALDSLDPAQAVQAAELLLARARFRGLTQIAQAGDQRVVAGLASSWKVSPNARRVEFVLREGIRASDGSPITPRVVRAWFDRLARKATGSPHAFLLSQVVGFREVNITGTAASLRGIKTPTGRKVVFELSTPFAELPVMLAHPSAGIVPGSGKDFGPSRPSSGPFTLREAELGRQAILVRNLASIGSTAYLERLELRVVQDGARALRAGTVDFAYLRGEAALDASSAQLWTTFSLGVNMKRISVRLARQAISRAIDPAALAEVGAPGVPASSLVPPGILAAPASVVSDTEAARAAWRASKHPTTPLRLVHLDDENSKALAASLREQLTAAGIKTKAIAVDAASYPRILQRRSFDLVQLGWLAEIPSPDGFLAGQLASVSVDNWSGFDDLAFDRAIARARSSVDEAARLAAYSDAQARALSELPMIPLTHLVIRYQGTDHIRGLSPDGGGSFDPATVWFTQTA